MTSTTRSIHRATSLAAVAILVLALAPGALATNGYFTHGYGTANKGLAGAGVALPQDALSPATNPAGLAFVGKRYDAGLALFNPNREYTIRGGPSFVPGTFGLLPGTVSSDSELFFVPYFGASWERGPNRVFGLALHGHGGMNTDYPTSTFFGTSPTGVDLSQLMIAPTYAFKVGGGDHAFGVSAILAYQSFEIQGVQAFGAFSADPARLSNRGHDDSFGIGAKLGYLGRLTSRLSVGLSYQPRISMDEFDAYAGLFAEQGGFDIPATWTAGVAVEVAPRVTVLFDVQESLFNSVDAIGNPLFPNLGRAFQGDRGSLLGGDRGPGFGWQDMTTYKLGVQIEGARDWTWRFGASVGDQPIPASEVLFNILAPGVMEEHFTFGFTRKMGTGRALSAALMHAPSSSVAGPNPLEVPGLQRIELEMDQWELEIGYSWGL